MSNIVIITYHIFFWGESQPETKHDQDIFGDTKGIIRSIESQKDRQYNGKIYLQNTVQKTKYRAIRTHYKSRVNPGVPKRLEVRAPLMTTIVLPLSVVICLKWWLQIYHKKPIAPAYGVYISQLICYTRAYTVFWVLNYYIIIFQVSYDITV